VDDLVRRWSPSMSMRELEADGERRTNSDGDRLTNGSYRYYVEVSGVPALAAAHRIKSRIAEPTGPNEVVLIQLDGPVQRGDDAGPVKLVFFLRELGLSAALFDPTTQQLRGAGFVRPSYVVATNAASAAAARRLLEGVGLNVRTLAMKPQR
jgi:hypothetical protein